MKAVIRSTSPRARPNSYVHLDFLRGLAALMVFSGHLRNLFFADLTDVPHPSLVTKVLYLATGFGHQAVMIFFVLSGFLISSSVMRLMDAGRWSWLSYLIARLTRLWVVLLPGLFLCAAWDLLGIHLFGAGSAYGSNPTGTNVVTPGIQDRLTLPVFMGNLLFLQGILVKPFGSDAPLWSLSFELWYYLWFPVLCMVFVLRHQRVASATYLLSALIIPLIVGRSIATYFLVWLMGTLVAFLSTSSRYRYHGTSPAVRLAAVVLVLGTLLLSRVLPSSFDLAADILVGISSSILVYCLTGALEATGVGLYPAICRKMSGCSYTLYVVHLPILIFLQSWLLSRSRWSPDLLHVCAGIGIAGLVLAYALLVAAVTEDKTDTFRLWLTRRIAQRNRTLMNAGHTSSRTYSIRGQL